MTRKARDAGDRISELEGGQKVPGLETQNDKEGRGCRRQKLRVRRRPGGAGTRSIVRRAGGRAGG